MDGLNAYRSPVSPASQRIIRYFIAHSLGDTPQDCPLLEICCGNGQLRDWLPDEICSRMVHLDFSEPLLQQFSQRHPAAELRHADVRCLPFEANSISAVLGLCAFDSLSCQEDVRDEIHRVLQPCGVFVHFLDMQSNLEPVFAEIVRRGRIPFPNFLDSPDLTFLLDGQMRQRLPQCQPLDDLVTLDQETFLVLLNFLQRTANPMAGDLVPFADNFLPDRFKANAATDAFMQLLQDPHRSSRVSRVLLSQALTFGEGRHDEVPPLRFEPCASIDVVGQRMKDWFQPSVGFEAQLAEIVSLREVRQREPGMPPVGRYHRRCVGKSEWLPAIPKNRIGQPLESMLAADEAENGSRRPTDDEVMIEVGMHVLIARKRKSG